MKKAIIAATVVASAAFAAPAMAWEGHVVECYDETWVPDKLAKKKTLHSAARYAWEHRNGQLVKVYYPAVYIEDSSVSKAGYWLKRKAPCAG